MAITYNVPGPAMVKVGTGTNGAYEDLGYTRNGAEVELRVFVEEVKSDDAGGEQGAPGDLNFLGEIAEITLELTRFDQTILDKVIDRMKSQGASPGIVPAPGLLWFTDGEAIKLALAPSKTGQNPWVFPIAAPTGAIRFNVGVNSQRVSMTWTAVRNPTDGVLFTRTLA